VTGIHRYNERQTSTLVSVLVSIPFTFITVLVRLLALSVIIAFLPQRSVMLLLLGIFCSLLVSNIIHHDLKEDCARQNPQGDVVNLLDCCIGRKCSLLLSCLPILMVKAVVDILVPLGYNKDTKLGQKSSRGSLLIFTNYVIVMVGLGLSLGFSILHHVPNTYHGLNMAKNGLKVEIPDTNLVLRTEYGMDIKVKIISK
jgi:hypothetical protein